MRTTSDSRHRLIGIALMCGAVACFAFLDTTAKYLNHSMDTLQVVWARYMSAFVLTLFISNPVSRPGLVHTSRPALQVGRAALLLLSSVFNFLALRFLQLDEVLAIMFSQPFLVAILAGPMLGEWVGWRRWIAESLRTSREDCATRSRSRPSLRHRCRTFSPRACSR